MMPMSPDDYNALRQLVTPVDMAAVVRSAAATQHTHNTVTPADKGISILAIAFR